MRRTACGICGLLLALPASAGSLDVCPLVMGHFWHRHYPKVSFAWALVFAIPFLWSYGARAGEEILHIYLVDYIFKNGAGPLPCTAMGDADCNTLINAADVVRLVLYVFKFSRQPCDISQLIPGYWNCP